MADLEYVNVVFRGEEFPIVIKPHWRTLPEDEGFTLFREKILQYCGCRPQSLRNSQGSIIRSFDFISHQETLEMEESPPLYEPSNQKSCECDFLKQKLNELYRALEIPFTSEPLPCDYKSSLSSKLSELDNKIKVMPTLDSENAPQLAQLDIQDQIKTIELKYDGLAAQLNEVKELSSDVKEKIVRIPVAPNLIRNSLMREVDSFKKPSGFYINDYKKGGTIDFEVVHPFVHGFEGCNTETAPENSVKPELCEIADKDHPVFYGRYNMGPRLSNGGLSTGFQGISDGHILKIWGTRVDQHENSINLPVISVGVATQIRFVAWIKCVKGAIAFSVGTYTNWNNPGPFLKDRKRKGVCRAEDCKKQPHGWLKMDQIVTSPGAINLNNRHGLKLRCFGPTESEGLGDFEIYVALPYASLVEQQDKVSIVPFPSEW